MACAAERSSTPTSSKPKPDEDRPGPRILRAMKPCLRVPARTARAVRSSRTANGQPSPPAADTSEAQVAGFQSSEQGAARIGTRHPDQPKPGPHMTARRETLLTPKSRTPYQQSVSNLADNLSGDRAPANVRVDSVPTFAARQCLTPRQHVGSEERCLDLHLSNSISCSVRSTSFYVSPVTTTDTTLSVPGDLATPHVSQAP